MNARYHWVYAWAPTLCIGFAARAQKKAQVKAPVEMSIVHDYFVAPDGAVCSSRDELAAYVEELSGNYWR